MARTKRFNVSIYLSDVIINPAIDAWLTRQSAQPTVKMFLFYKKSSAYEFGVLTIAPRRPDVSWSIGLPEAMLASETRKAIFDKIYQRAGRLPLMPSNDNAIQLPAEFQARAGEDVTEYARSIGYTGKRRVIVHGGRVTNHRNMNWLVFCENCRERASTNARLAG
ncbi:hypothetical protein [Marinobacter sp. ELB17]|uniref:hypothetical protein n=1 Tax=Marinobacter sp. ELB17 TaxID=270374 RepID=UPI0000F36AAA|nr:hypothetical protein MELB17_10048 [Marinobacter sp. ELB17]